MSPWYASSMGFGWKYQWTRVQRWFKRLENIKEKYAAEELSKEDVDDIIAFFQNCYHLKDWMINTLPSLKENIEHFINEKFEMRICHDICNGFKHKRLNRAKIDKNFAILQEYDYETAETQPWKNTTITKFVFGNELDPKKIGSFEFQVGEFNDSLEKIKPLLSRLGKSIDDFNAIKDAVSWLNKSIEPFQNYLNYRENNKIDKKLISLTPKNFENFNNEQLQELASTFEGQRFKREILNQLYPQETPKRQKIYEYCPFDLAERCYNLWKEFIKNNNL